MENRKILKIELKITEVGKRLLIEAIPTGERSFVPKANSIPIAILDPEPNDGHWVKAGNLARDLSEAFLKEAIKNLEELQKNGIESLYEDPTQAPQPPENTHDSEDSYANLTYTLMNELRKEKGITGESEANEHFSAIYGALYNLCKKIGCLSTSNEVWAAIVKGGYSSEQQFAVNALIAALNCFSEDLQFP